MAYDVMVNLLIYHSSGPAVIKLGKCFKPKGEN